MKIGDLEKVLGKLQTAVKKAQEIKLDPKSASDLQTLTSKLAKEVEKS